MSKSVFCHSWASSDFSLCCFAAIVLTSLHLSLFSLSLGVVGDLPKVFGKEATVKSLDSTSGLKKRAGKGGSNPKFNDLD